MSKFINVDDWISQPKDNIVSYDGKVMVIPFDKFFGHANDTLNVFVIKKETYTNQLPMLCHYINYFMKFYDTNGELMMSYLRIKYIIDKKSSMFKDNEQFTDFLYSTIMTDSMIEKISRLVEDNYNIDVEESSDDQKFAEELKYTNAHAKILLKISTAMKILVPALFHYINAKGISKDTVFLYMNYEPLFDVFTEYDEGETLYNKLYMTIKSQVVWNVSRNKGIWAKREILGDDPVTYTDELFKNKFICNLLFRYNFQKNVISFNNSVIDNQLGYFTVQPFDHDLNEVSHITESDGLSNIDKMEMNSAKIDESLVTLSSVNIKQTMKRIKSTMALTLSKEEIQFYRRFHTVNKFQSQLVLYFYAKTFGGFRDLHLLTKEQYMTLLILLKKRLQIFGNVYLPQLLSGNIDSRLNTRTIKNNKFLNKMQTSEIYKSLMEDKFSTLEELGKSNLILTIISTLLNTTFTSVDYDHPERLGEKIEINNDILCDEFLNFLNQI